MAPFPWTASTSSTTPTVTKAFSKAVERGNLTRVETWVAQYCHTNIANEDCHNVLSHALQVAAKKGHIEIVRCLLRINPSINDVLLIAKDNQGYTAFHLAAAHGHAQVVQTLLDATTIDLNSKTGCGREGDSDKHFATTALVLAVRRGHFDVVRLLVQAGASPLNALHMAIIYCQCNCIVYLVDQFPHLLYEQDKQEGYTVLHEAARIGNVELVGWLMRMQAQYPPSTAQTDWYFSGVSGDTPVHLAIKHGHLEIVRALLSFAVANANQETETMTNLISDNQSNTWTSPIWRLEASNRFGETPLHTAIRAGRSSVLFEFLVEKAQAANRLSEILSAKDYKGYTPLHEAVQVGDLERAKWLVAWIRNNFESSNEQSETLRHFVRDYPRDMTGQPLLDLAAGAGHLHIVDWLVSIYPPHAKRARPWILATSNGHVNVSFYLLRLDPTVIWQIEGKTHLY